MRSIFNFLIPFLCLIVFLNIENLSQTMQTDIKNLAVGADIIVIGKVVDQKSQWNTDQTRILTKSTIQVDEYLKGNSGNNSIVVITPGGEVGEVGELYSHMPRFTNDEEVLVFVKENKRDLSYRVLNGEDGKITLYRDEKTGEIITPLNKKISTLKKEIKGYVEKE